MNPLHQANALYRYWRLRLFRYHMKLFRRRLQRRTRITVTDRWQVGREFEKR